MSQAHTRTAIDFTPTGHHDTYDFISPLKSDLSGKSVFITGASKGIGKETAISYARAGASKIAIGARSPLAALENEIQEAAKAAGRAIPQVLSLFLDVTDRKSVDDAIEKIRVKFGTLNILINDAGYLENWKAIHESDPDEWWRTWEVNIKGLYLVTRAALPLILDAPGGLRVILNVSSVGSQFVRPLGSSYQTSKLALLRLTEFIQVEYADKGLLALSIHPGGVPTELALGMPQDMYSWLIDTPQLAGDSIIWLTRENRKWLKGRYVSVSWDMEELEKMKEEIVEKDLLKIRMVLE